MNNPAVKIPDRLLMYPCEDSEWSLVLLVYEWTSFLLFIDAMIKAIGKPVMISSLAETPDWCCISWGSDTRIPERILSLAKMIKSNVMECADTASAIAAVKEILSTNNIDRK